MPSRYYSSLAAETALTSPVSSSAVNIVVDSVSGFPGFYPYTLSIDSDSDSKELVEVTAATGTALTVIRGVDGTSAIAHLLGAKVRHDHSARDFRESREHESSLAAHGVSGNVVGTTDTQTLTNKDLTAPSNVFPAAIANAEQSAKDYTDSEVAAATAHSDAADLAATAYTNSQVTAAAATAKSYTDTQVAGAKTYTDGKVSTASTADRARGNHTGTQTSDTISDFTTAVRTNRLNQMGTPSGNVSLGGYKMTGSGAPTSATDLATKKYVDDATALPPFRSGRVTIHPESNEWTSVDVSFSPPFTNLSSITVQVTADTTSEAVKNASYSGITLTGCKVGVLRSNSTNTNVSWFAIGT